MFARFLPKGLMILLLLAAQPVWSADDKGLAVGGLAEVVGLLDRDELSKLLSDPGTARVFLRRMSMYAKVERLATEQGLLAEPRVQRELASARRGLLIDRLKTQDLIDNPAPAEAIEALARDYYDAYKEDFRVPRKIKIGQISIATDACSPEQTEARIAQARDRIDQGEAFEAVARDVSDAPNASVGGSIKEWFVDGVQLTSAAFFQHAFELADPGDVSSPFEFGTGFHIVQLLEQTPASVPSFDAVKDALEGQILSAYTARQSAAFMASLYPGVKDRLDVRELERLVRDRLNH